jgi:hypothetical protein
MPSTMKTKKPKRRIANHEKDTCNNWYAFWIGSWTSLHPCLYNSSNANRVDDNYSFGRAELAGQADKTGEQAKTYLDKAKAWYANAKANASKKWHDILNATCDRIDTAKQTVKNKRDQAGEAINKLAKRAAVPLILVC